MLDTDKKMAMIAKIASLYYESGKTQQDIADEVGIARTMVSRFLNEAREKDIVRFIVRYPWTSEELEQELIARFGLKSARVIVAVEDLDKDALSLLGLVAARFLEETLTETSIVGISWGTALYRMIECLNMQKLPDVEIVQLIGATGSERNLYDGPLLAQLLAERLHCKSSLLHAPLIVNSGEVRDALLQDQHISHVLGKATAVDIALIGIGALDPEYSLLRTGYVTMEEMNRIIDVGGYGDICARHFSKDGQELNTELSRRTIGISLSTLKKIETVIAVAGGQKKAKAIWGALQGGYMNVLITDHAAAFEILRLDDEARKAVR